MHETHNFAMQDTFIIFGYDNESNKASDLCERHIA